MSSILSTSKFHFFLIFNFIKLKKKSVFQNQKTAPQKFLSANVEFWFLKSMFKNPKLFFLIPPESHFEIQQIEFGDFDNPKSIFSSQISNFSSTKILILYQLQPGARPCIKIHQVSFAQLKGFQFDKLLSFGHPFVRSTKQTNFKPIQIVLILHIIIDYS